MTDFFSPDYHSARARFRSGVLANSGQIESILLDAKSPHGEDLTIDIGCFGSPEPRRVFIHSSGLHGVEGFAGSAIQAAWLEDGMPNLPPDGAIILVHAMNPFGMAWLRRVNENNVDLNRNFLGSEEAYAGAPESYAAMNSLLNPESPPTYDFFRLRAACKVLRHGMPAFRHAVTAGQYDFPRGLFFGGRQHEQETRRFQLYISGKLAHADRVVALDVHTGPGRFGEDVLEPVDLVQTRGALGGLYLRMFPGAQVHFAVQRFGVCNRLKAFAALRSENRRRHYGGGKAGRPDLLEVFCPSDRKWREKVLAGGKEVIAQSIALAFNQPPPTV